MENEVQKKGKKKLLIPLLLLLLLLVGGGVFAATQLLGGGAKYGPEVDVSDFQTLKEAIETTEEGQTRTLTLLNDIFMEDTITLPEGTVINIKDDGTTRSLTRDLSDAWMFWVPEESTLTIKGSKPGAVVLDGASGTIKSGPDGALIIAEYATIELDNVAMKDNRSNQGLGGMMRLVGCDVTATNSTFNNGAAKSGGVVYAVESNVSFTDCDLSGNSSTVGHGGAVYVDNASELTLERCALNNNEVLTGAGYGGAVIVTNFSHATINDCTMDNNVLDHDGFANGGAMYIAWGSVVDITNTSFANNTVLGTENHLGGAIYINEGSTVNIGEGTKFIGNTGSHGGAIYAIDTATVNLDGVYFEDNHATIGNGGAIYCWRDPVLNAKNCTFIKNYTKAEGNAYGGAVALATGAPVATIENCTFEGNYTDNVGYCNGGALLVGEGSDVTLLGNNVFKDNWGKSTGGKNTCGGAVYVSKASLTIEDGTSFVGNYGSHGGAIYVNYGGLLVMDGTKFDKNYSYYGHAGALCAWNGGEVEAKNCSFTNNYIKSDKGGYGGAVAIYNKDKEEYNSVGTFTNCTFVGNKTVRTTGEANANGGAIYAGMGGDVYVNGGSFRNNYARTADLTNTKLAWRGGAIYANTNSTLKVNGATFTGNSGQYGGAIFAQESALLTVTNSTFTGNNTTDKGSHGGAIYANRMLATITGCKFTENWAQGIAGAVMINGKENTMGAGVIKNCTFTKNYTPLRVGGAVASYDGIKLEVSGSTFTGNYTNYSHGGAVYTQNMPAVIKSSTFTGNYIESAAGGYGGAVAIVNDSSHFEESAGTITDCTFDGNYSVRTEGSTANANGGAVYFGLYTKAVVDGNTSFTNNYAKIADESAVAYGGGIYLNTGCNMIVGENVTFTGNSAKRGGAIGIGGASAAKTVVNLNGPTMTGNTATDYGAGVYFDQYADLSINGITITPAEGEQVPDIRIRDGLTLDLQGKVNIGTVEYETTKSLIHLDAALAEGSAITIIPAEYTEGLQVVTAAEVEAAEGAEPVNLLAGIGAKILVATPADNSAWIVNDEGKLENQTPVVFIGEVGYLTLDEALAAAQSGDEIVLVGNVKVKADAEIPADVTLKNEGGYTITVVDGATLTVSNDVLKGASVVGNVAAKDGADLTDATITGKVTVAENATLTVGGAFTAGEVNLAAGAKVNVATALTAETKAFLLTSAVETLDTVLVTAPDVAAARAAIAKIEASFVDTKIGLGGTSEDHEDESVGKIISDVYVAYIVRDGVKTGYEKLEDAATAALDGETILIAKSFTVASTEGTTDMRLCADGKTINVDGNGKTLTRGETMLTTMLYAKNGGVLNVKNLTVDGNNVAAKEGIILSNATINLDNVTVKNAYNAGSNGTNGGGGAITNNAVVTVKNSTFINNGASTAGGAIFNKNAATVSLTVTDSTFTDNYVDIEHSGGARGGAVYNHKTSTAIITNCVFENNRANSTYTYVEEGANDNVINAKSNVGLGGAVYNNGGSLTLNGNTFKNNYASQAGGAFFMLGTVTLENNTFTGNMATPKKVRETANYTIGGGAVAVNAGTLTIKDGNVFENNGSDQLWLGGAIHGFYNANIIVDGGTFTGNKAAQGGVIHNTGATVVNGGTFEGNSVTDAGGALMAPNLASATITVNDGTFKDNKATNGGAIFVHASAALTVNGGTFEGNDATSGGVIKSNGGVVTITDGTFKANTAKQGVVLYWEGANTHTISGGIFDTNVSSDAGGVTFAKSGSTGTLKVTGGTYTNNTATNNGGVFYNHAATKLEVSDVVMTGNYAKNGGALFNNGGGMTVNSGTFENNSATMGGVIYGKANTVINGGTFKGNRANDAGGVAAVYGAPFTITGGTFEANTCKTNGGAFYIGGTAGNSYKLTLSGGTMLGNTSDRDGGNDISMGADASGKGCCVIITDGSTVQIGVLARRNNIAVCSITYVKDGATVDLTGKSDAEVKEALAAYGVTSVILTK